MAPYCSWTAQGSYTCAQPERYEDYEEPTYEDYGDYQVEYEGFSGTKKPVPPPQHCISAAVFNHGDPHPIGEPLKTRVPFNGFSDKGFVRMLRGGDFHKLEIRNIPCGQIKSPQTVPRVVPKAPAPKAPAPKAPAPRAPTPTQRPVVKTTTAPVQATLTSLLTGKIPTMTRINIRSVGATGTCLQAAGFGVGACPATPGITVKKAPPPEGKGYTISGPKGNYFSARDGPVGVSVKFHADQDWTFDKVNGQNAFRIRNNLTGKCLTVSKGPTGNNTLGVAPCSMSNMQLWQ